VGRPNQQGRFAIRGLPPETYGVVAVPNQLGTEWQDPEYLEGLRALAEQVTLGEGEAKTLTLAARR